MILCDVFAESGKKDNMKVTSKLAYLMKEYKKVNALRLFLNIIIRIKIVLMMLKRSESEN